LHKHTKAVHTVDVSDEHADTYPHKSFSASRGNPASLTPLHGPFRVRQRLDVRTLPPDEYARLTHQRKAERRQRQLEIRTQRERAYALWMQGCSVSEIAAHLNRPHSTVYSWIKREDTIYHKEYEQEIDVKRRKHWRRGEYRIRQLMTRLSAELNKGTDSDGIVMAQISNAITSVETQQAKLYGLNAPTKIAATTPDGESWAPLTASIAAGLTDEELAVAIKLARNRVTLTGHSPLAALPDAAIEAEVLIHEPVKRLHE
jgi:DNA-binding CsgD family transcriptional regulator